MIFTLNAHGCTWEESALDGTVYINTPEASPDYKNYRHGGSYRLNSRKILHEFIRKLKTISHLLRCTTRDTIGCKFCDTASLEYE